jgi:hypothetical protein
MPSMRVVQRVAANFVCAALLMCATNLIADDNSFQAGALRGVTRVTIKVEGIAAKFERYGLTEAKVTQQLNTRLTDYGLDIVDLNTASSDPGSSQLLIKLYANQDSFAFYSYSLSVKLNRKIPLSADGTAFVSQTVWSKGQSGVLNPSDLPRLYDSLDTLVSHLLNEHGRDNAGVQATPSHE